MSQRSSRAQLLSQLFAEFGVEPVVVIVYPSLVLLAVLVDVLKHLTNSHIRNEALLWAQSSRVWPIPVRKVWEQQSEAVGHMAATVRKVLSPFPSFSSGTFHL